jgi:predicted GNAT family N-acyltransferase
VRHAGVGRLLVARLLEIVPRTAVISLFCSRDLTDFYAGHGFHPTSQLVMHCQIDS